MEIKKRYIVLFIIILAGAWLLQNKAIQHIGNEKYASSFRQIRNIKKLLILDQQFLLKDMSSLEKAYPFMSSVIVSGHLGFDIDLADSTNTKIEAVNDTIIVSAPLRISYVNFDVSTTQPIEDMVQDSSQHINQAKVLQTLNKETLAQYIPLISKNLKYGDLFVPQKQLNNLTGVPVKIVLTQMPKL